MYFLIVIFFYHGDLVVKTGSGGSLSRRFMYVFGIILVLFLYYFDIILVLLDGICFVLVLLETLWNLSR